MRGMDVCLAVNSHGGNAHFSSSTHDAYRNFAAVGDKQFGDWTDAICVHVPLVWQARR